MRIVLGFDDDVARFAGLKLGTIFHPPYTAFGIVDDADQLCGAIIFNNYNGFNIEATVYAPDMWTRPFIRAALDYVFNQLGCLRLTCRSTRANKRALRALPRLGFEYEGTLRRYFGPAKKDDAILYRLDKDKAGKWLRRKING